jgi:hypothetical protein
MRSPQTTPGREDEER